jgi:cold shock CspA family protein
MSSSRERGTVLSWKDAKGHGRIKSDAGDVLWAHFAFIDQEEGFRKLSPGQRVEFTRVESPGAGIQRWQAWNVQILKS